MAMPENIAMLIQHPRFRRKLLTALLLGFSLQFLKN